MIQNDLKSHMEIIGITVHHKRFGDGVITQCDNKMVLASFSNQDGSKYEIKFVFPDVFKSKFLVSSDPRLDEYIKDYTKSKICSVCEKETANITEVDGERLCDSCLKMHTKKCSHCNQIHLADDFSSVVLSEYPYYISLCKDCYSHYIYKCDDCNKNFISDAPVHTYKDKVYCDKCYQDLFCKCDICDAEYFEDQGKRVYSDDDSFYACPKCVEKKTFVCSECDRLILKEYLVDSKYVPAHKQVCNRCVSTCKSCGEAVDAEHSCSYFGKTYCKECEASKKSECSICEYEFISGDKNQTLCPECIDATEYLEMTQKIDFSSRRAKVMSVYDLDYIDRCQLFTDLYLSCSSLEENSVWKKKEVPNPYHYLIMRIFGHQAVVTYLPRGITQKIRHSANITVTI